MRDLRRMLLVLAAMMLALGVASCGDDDDEQSSGNQTTETKSDVSGTVSTMAIWSGPEQKAFRAVLDGFEEKYPNVTARYDSAGDQLPTVLSTAVEGGNPPDVAIVGQPGLVEQFQEKGALKPINFVRETVEQDFGESWVDVGTVDGKLYGLLFKAANKSTVWFNTQVFEDAGVEPPEDWETFLSNAETLGQSGTPAYSLGAADGWTLTDLFENIYLRQAGPEKYDQLATHKIKWTDPSVVEALETMAKILGDTDNIVGGKSGALETDFPKSVENVFTLDSSTTTVPAVSVLIVSLPPAASMILPVRRSPFTKRISSAMAAPVIARHSTSTIEATLWTRLMSCPLIRRL